MYVLGKKQKQKQKQNNKQKTHSAENFLNKPKFLETKMEKLYIYMYIFVFSWTCIKHYWSCRKKKKKKSRLLA